MVEKLPAYAPELNPVEYLWAHLKEHQIANLLVTHGWELSLHATAALRRMREQARAAGKFKMAQGLAYSGADTAFDGYEHLAIEDSAMARGSIAVASR